MSNFLEGHKKDIMLGAGLGALLVTIPLTVVATRKFDKEAEEYKRFNRIDKIPPKVMLWLLLKHYGIVGATATTGSILAIKAYKISSAETLMLGAGLQGANQKIKNLKESAKEIVGDEKAEEIDNRAEEKGVQNKKSATVPELSELDTPAAQLQTYKEYISGRMFITSPASFDEAIDKFDLMVLSEGEASLNDFYEFLNIDYTEFGNKVTREPIRDKIHQEPMKDKYGRVYIEYTFEDGTWRD